MFWCVYLCLCLFILINYIIIYIIFYIKLVQKSNFAINFDFKDKIKFEDGIVKSKNLNFEHKKETFTLISYKTREAAHQYF